MHFHGNKGWLRFHEDSHQVFTQNIDFDTDLSRPLVSLGSITGRIIDVLHTAGASWFLAEMKRHFPNITAGDA